MALVLYGPEGMHKAARAACKKFHGILSNYSQAIQRNLNQKEFANPFFKALDGI